MGRAIAKENSRTITTADLIGVVVDFAAATVSTRSSGLAMQHSVAADALPVIIEDRVTATRI